MGRVDTATRILLYLLFFLCYFNHTRCSLALNLLSLTVSLGALDFCFGCSSRELNCAVDLKMISNYVTYTKMLSFKLAFREFLVSNWLCVMWLCSSSTMINLLLYNLLAAFFCRAWSLFFKWMDRCIDVLENRMGSFNKLF